MASMWLMMARPTGVLRESRLSQWRRSNPVPGAHAPDTADDGMTPSRLVVACPAGMLREGRLGLWRLNDS